MKTLPWRKPAAAAAWWLAASAANAAGPAPACAMAAMVCATVQSRFQGEPDDEGGERRYFVRLKLPHGAHAPFGTITYRVADRATWDRLLPRSAVAFTAARLDGENMLTAVRIRPP